MATILPSAPKVAYSLSTVSEYATFGGDMDQAVLFRSGGVACRFIEDNFNQVIFWGRAVSKPFYHMTATLDEDKEPHDWEWQVHHDGRSYPCADLFAAIRQVRLLAEMPTTAAAQPETNRDDAPTPG